MGSFIAAWMEGPVVSAKGPSGWRYLMTTGLINVWSVTQRSTVSAEGG